MEVWAVGEDRLLHGVWWDGEWQPWYPVSMFNIASRTPLAAMSRFEDHMEVWFVGPGVPNPAVVGVNGSYWDGNWSGVFRIG